VKAAVVGGGPAGLFFALLLKRADPRHDVAVYERNRPDDTFGFGVVFSDATEEALAHGRSRRRRRDGCEEPPLGRHRDPLPG
jgi:2-polyprenyl-6-methoxyphenol hydroxylase-like FAD-dependent oxidoreductase